MISSYQFAERYNAQSILHGAWLALVAVVVFLAKLETYMLIAVVGGAVGLGLFAVISAIPVTFWLGLVIVAIFAVATFPRTAVRNG